LDLVLKNGRVVDGTGNPWFVGDVAIKDGTIASLGRVRQKSRRTIDVGRQVISPGFIDGYQCATSGMIFSGQAACDGLDTAPNSERVSWLSARRSL
jgi:N-acyl-D-amino-acid deacylase